MSVTNPRTERDLELAKVLGQIARFAASQLGRQAVLDLTPSADREHIEDELAHVEEMVRAVREGFSPGAISDLRPLIEEAKGHGDLKPEQLLTVAETLEAASELQTALRGGGRRLSALAGRLSDQWQLARAIRACIDDRGQVRDDATPKLRQLVSKQRTLTGRITDGLQRFLARHRALVQEPVITQRGGRYVVPLRSGAQGAAAVVVHDTSASGQTVFCEPHAVVHLNNQLREVEDQIRREKDRILIELAGKLVAEEPRLRRDMQVLARLDGMFAQARYALAQRAVTPQLTADTRVELVEARHPLLGERAVPITVAFGGDRPMAVITGPNTGGKTVTLKTIGLFVLMAQCGIPVPASPRTTLGVFAQVRSDIGEEQSIEQNLSTFSSHMKNIVEIISELDDRTLVLLDELGAGTDPQEGAALGLAILERLLEAQVTAAVATHLTPLKHFAISHPQVLSCSMAFDLETLSPTFQVQEGVPGRSCALIIAGRLGLPEELVARARAKLSAEEVRAEQIIEQLERERAAARRAGADLEAERSAARRLREDYERRLADLKARKTEAVGGQLKRLEGELRSARRELAELIAQARSAESAAERREALRRVQELARTVPQAPSPGRRPPIEAGDTVRIRATGAVGMVQRVEPDRVEVQVKGRRVELPPEALETAAPPPQAAPPRPSIPPGREVSLELSVRGLTADQAKRQVQAWLDRLLLADVHSGRLIHGKGTGALRQALHTFLADLPYVRRHYLAPPEQGGDGVTIVEL
ncbi:MAG: endonuclease MutS2 [Candidatus Bipolaricaulaceae bacterium]